MGQVKDEWNRIDPINKIIKPIYQQINLFDTRQLASDPCGTSKVGHIFHIFKNLFQEGQKEEKEIPSHF